MEGKYPIIIDGALCGFLKVEERGALTEFRAECGMLPGIVRLSVYGGGREGYLGVLMPDSDGRLRLKKSFSRTAMRDFPRDIDHAGVAGEKWEDSPAVAKAAPEKYDEKAKACEDELYWYSSPDGALVCFDGEHSLIALPLGDERIQAEPKGALKQIEGNEYMVYITKDGRVVG